LNSTLSPVCTWLYSATDKWPQNVQYTTHYLIIWHIIR